MTVMTWTAEIDFIAVAVPEQDEQLATFAAVLMQVPGVAVVDVDLPGGLVTVCASPVNGRMSLDGTYRWVERLIASVFDADLETELSPRDGALAGVRGYRLHSVSLEDLQEWEQRVAAERTGRVGAGQRAA